MARPGVLILGNMDKPGIHEQIDSFCRWLSPHAEVLGVHSHDEAPPERASRAKVCVVFGGDGTLLSAGRKYSPLGVPLLGVNMGKLGFLAEYGVEDLQTHFEAILAGRIEPVERIVLSAYVTDCDPAGEGEKTYCSLALNDVAISAGEPFRVIDLQVAQGDHQVARYCGDGLVVATPTGSTGYNLSAGGPILQPTLDAVVITPVAPHTLSLRPMVVRPEPPIHITATRVNAGTTLIIDGQVPHRLGEGQRVEVRRAEHPMRLFPLPGRHYFDTLAGKLHWGRSPHHNES